MDRKYEFTGETNAIGKATLHRIKAVRDIKTNRGVIKAGELGGWIEKESNLSHDDGCWVFDEACVYGEMAKVCDNAVVLDNAHVYENAIVCNNVKIYDNSSVHGNAIICGSSLIKDHCDIYDNARIADNSLIADYAKIYEFAYVFGFARIHDASQVFGNARVGYASNIYGNALVYGDARIIAHTCIRGNAIIQSNTDYITIGPIGSRDDYTTFFKGKDGNIYVVCGCFEGNLDEFTEAVRNKYGYFCQHGALYMNAAHMASMRLNWNDEENFNRGDICVDV